jgi:thiamine pyrophosphate-dependent acetolactate synthase large subunit-like protein
MIEEESAYGAREIVRFLSEHGHRHIFGLPGSSMVAALHELQRTDIDYVPAIHESVAVAAADGYARVAGSAVTMLYMLHGVANGLANLYNAWRDESPLIVIASQQTSKHRTPGWTVGEGDMVNLTRPYTRLSHELTGGMPVRAWLESAYRASTGPLPGPAFLSMTQDVFELPGPVAKLRSSVRAASNAPDATMVAQALAGAERPLIVVGGQLRRFGGSETIEQIASAHGIAMVYESGFNDRLGAAPGHPNMLGSIGANGIPAEQTADAVLLLGTRAMLEAHPRPTWFPAANFIAHVNADPAKLEETLTADWSCACDPGAFATALKKVLETLTPMPDRLAMREDELRDMNERPVTGPLANILKPYSAAVAALHDALDRGWVVDEAVMGSVALMGGLRSLDGSRYVGTTGAALGWGTGAAAGVALASGEPVTCVLGDGALRFGALGLWTIRALNLPVTLVILDNGGYGSTRYYERQYIDRLGADASPAHPSYHGSDLRNTGSTVGGIIEGFGIPCRTLSPTDDPRAAVSDAWSRSSEGPNAVVIPLGFDVG